MLLLLSTAALAQSMPPIALPPAPPPRQDASAIQAALSRFPPLLLGANVQPVMAPGTIIPRPCPAPGARVNPRGGAAIIYDGADPSDPILCRTSAGPTWFGLWPQSRAGAPYAARALQTVLQGRTGDAAAFDTTEPGIGQWHDLLRNDGLEEITLAGQTWRAIRIAHYREGIPPTPDRSLVMSWKDVDTGIVIYATHQHIAGRPDLEAPLIPTAIQAAP